MPRKPPLRAVSPVTRAAPTAGELLVTLGLALSLALSFVLWLADSPEQLRDGKLAFQALGASAALLGLALVARRRNPLPSLPDLSPSVRTGIAALAGALVLALVSALANPSRVDPLTIVAVLAPVALAVAGASAPGAAAAPRVFVALMAVGAATGLLAAAQRFLGVLRILRMETPEPRFQAAALIGNPGDVGAALVAPALLLWIALTSAAGVRPRLLYGAGLGAALAGLGATEAIAPVGALAAGVLLHSILDLKRRWRPLVAAALLLAGAAAATGAGRRILTKIEQFRSGKTAAASTQRDIGILAAVEMIRARPILGVGPGAFENAFIPARLRAEERAGRRFRHDSGFAHFENAHNEVLTLAAENGLPAAALSLVFLGTISAGLFVASVRKADGSAIGETAPDTLLALLASFAVLSLASFPLRLALSAGPAAYALGLSTRVGRRPAAREPAAAPRAAVAIALVAILLLGAAAVRLSAVSLQADGELRLQATPVFQGAARSDLNDSARRQLKRALALRPMSPTGWIALGSTYRLEEDWENAFLAYARSLSIEERGETDFNLGLVVLAGSQPTKALEFFRRGIWILPALAEMLPPVVDRGALQNSISEAVAALPKGGRAPELPDGLTPKL
jgi:O-antigen ligase